MDIAITAATVLPSPAAQIINGKTAGAAITAGQSIFKDTDGTIKPANALGAAPANAPIGVAVNTAAAGQPVSYVTSDPQFTLGGAIAAGKAVAALGANPGGIAPDTDVVAGWFVTVLGVGIGNNQINLSIIQSGVAAA